MCSCVLDYTLANRSVGARKINVESCPSYMMKLFHSGCLIYHPLQQCSGLTTIDLLDII